MSQPPRSVLPLPAMWLMLTAGTAAEAIGQPTVLPAAAGGWSRTDSVHLYAGKELYLLVDGGADLFLEYGFRQASSTEYALPPDGNATVELYEMSSAPAAYGLFTSFTAGTGRPVPIGQEGVVGDGYALFWKGIYVGMVTAGSADSVTGTLLLRLAEGLAKRIEGTGTVPDLCQLLRKGGLDQTRMVYIRGKLALANQIPQAWAAAFSPAEGVAGTAGESRYLILEYANAAMAESALGTAAVRWAELGLAAVRDSLSGWSIPGDNEATTQLEQHGRYLFAVTAGDEAGEKLVHLIRRLVQQGPATLPDD